MFNTIVSQLHRANTATNCTSKIDLQDYLIWQKNFTFAALKDPHYGRNFCNCFDVADNRIYYERNWERCDDIIRSEWLERS